MARYNSIIPTVSLAAGSTTALTTPLAGQLTKFTGTTYGVTIGDPALFSGQSQTFYNAASGVITLTSSGTGVFRGPGSSGTATQTITASSTLTLYSDGTDWITAFDGGGPLVATTGAFSGNLTLSGTTPTINFNNAAPTIATNSSGSTASVFDTNVTTLNIGGAATSVALAANGATTTLKGRLSYAGSSSGTVTFQAAAAAGSAVYTWPTADASASGQALVSNAAGVLSWATQGAVITDDTSTALLYPLMSIPTSGSSTSVRVSSSRMSFNASTGTLTTTAISTGTLTETSSITLKENLNPITDGLNKILQLTSYTYDRRDGTSKNEAGLIAEEVSKIIPNLVTFDKDGNPFGIQYSKLTAYLVDAVKSLSEEIDYLKGNTKNKGKK